MNLTVFYLLHLTDVEDTHHRVAFLEGGAILNLPMFYLEGTDSFLRIIHYCIQFLVSFARDKEF